RQHVHRNRRWRRTCQQHRRRFCLKTCPPGDGSVGRRQGILNRAHHGTQTRSARRHRGRSRYVRLDNSMESRIDRMNFRNTRRQAAALAACFLSLAAVAIAQPPAPATSLSAAPSSGTPKFATPKSALLVLAKQDHTLAIVDPATLQVVARIPVGDDPHEVVASSDGRTAYVSNYGFGAFHTLAVIDLVGQEAEPQIDLGALRGPHGLAFA